MTRKQKLQLRAEAYGCRINYNLPSTEVHAACWLDGYRAAIGDLRKEIRRIGSVGSTRVEETGLAALDFVSPIK